MLCLLLTILDVGFPPPWPAFVSIRIMRGLVCIKHNIYDINFIQADLSPENILHFLKCIIFFPAGKLRAKVTNRSYIIITVCHTELRQFLFFFNGPQRVEQNSIPRKNNFRSRRDVYTYTVNQPLRFAEYFKMEWQFYS